MASRPTNPGFFLLLLAASCSVFDESLIEETGDGSQELAADDDLSCGVPANESVNDYRSVRLDLFEDNVSTLPNCLGEVDAPGNDGFFRVRMNADEKWHFHVRVPTVASDPAVYVLGSCSDARSCRDTYWGINACGDGEPEHFSFVAPSTGDYIVGIDGLRASQEAVEVLAVNADCGNGAVEHSEFCDDTNDDPRDGCHECRPVLSANAAESEPNDGPLDPNLVVFPDGGGSISVTGTLGTRCDFDFFRVSVPDNARLEVGLAGNAAACRQSDLQVRGLTDPNPFLVEPADPSGACSMLVREGLAEGEYLVRVAPHRELGVAGGAVSYTLTVALTAP